MPFLLRSTPAQQYQGPQFQLKSSASLRIGSGAAHTRQWLAAMMSSSLLLSAMLAVMHPDQYVMCRACIKRLPSHCDDAEALNWWYSLFNGVQIISNRETPLHRDNGTQLPWLDVLATVGPYRGGTFHLPGIGLDLKYSSGTVIGLCGRLLRHGVSGVDGERICVAYFMRSNVQQRVDTKLAQWGYL